MNKTAGLGRMKFDEYIIRPSKSRGGCRCGNRGKEIFFYEKNRILYSIKLLRKHHVKNISS